MRDTIDTPGHVQDPHVSKDAAHEEPRGRATKPNVSHECREAIATHENEGEIVLGLEHHEGITREVVTIELSSRRNDLGVFSDHDPATMGKKETPTGIMWIGIRLTAFMMDTMIPAPFKDAALKRHTIRKQEKDLQTRRGFVAAMGPQTMGSGGNPETTQDPHPEPQDTQVSPGGIWNDSHECIERPNVPQT